jgi:hypothetical protein
LEQGFKWVGDLEIGFWAGLMIYSGDSDFLSKY